MLVIIVFGLMLRVSDSIFSSHDLSYFVVGGRGGYMAFGDGGDFPKALSLRGLRFALLVLPWLRGSLAYIEPRSLSARSFLCIHPF